MKCDYKITFDRKTDAPKYCNKKAIVITLPVPIGDVRHLCSKHAIAVNHPQNDT